MVQIAVFVLVLIAVFAAKAVSIALTRDDMVAMSESFSWMKATPEDAVVASEAATESASTVRGGAAAPVYARRVKLA